MNAEAAPRIEKWNYLLGGIASVVGYVTLPTHQALGFFLGALFSAINFSLLRRLVGRLLSKQSRSAGPALLLVPKMGVLLGGVAVAVVVWDASPIFLAIGFSVFFVSIAIELLRVLRERHG
jgi:hypothetical protein